MSMVAVSKSLTGSGAQIRILLERLADEGDIRIGERAGPGEPRTVEAVGVDGGAHRVRVKPKSRGDRSDLPVFGVEQTSDLGDLLGGDHRSPPAPERID